MGLLHSVAITVPRIKCAFFMFFRCHKIISSPLVEAYPNCKDLVIRMSRTDEFTFVKICNSAVTL
jgi:hypothetical protein